MLTATDIMTKDVVTIRSSATAVEAIGLMQAKGIKALIVDRRYAQDAYGIVTATDILAKVTAMGRSPDQVRVFEIMTKPCITVNPDLGVTYIARLFMQTGIQQAPVIQGKLLGLISTTDILTLGTTDGLSHEVQLTQEIQDGITQAQTICDQVGPTAEACVQAWRAVDEIQAEVAHLRAERLEQTAFEAFCEAYPEVFQAQEYDAWCSG